MDKTNEFQMLLVGVDDETRKLILELCKGAILTEVKSMPDFEAGFESWVDGKFAAAICGPAIKELNGAEIAQTLQNQCPKTYKVYITRDLNAFQPTILKKNGISDAYILPQDDLLIRKELTANVMSVVTKMKDLRAVKLDDVEAGEKLNFETYVFLPMNRRYVRFSAADRPMEEERLKRLNEQNMSTLFVDQKEMGKFYEHAAKKLKDLCGEGGAMGETEKQAKREQKVRNLFVTIFDQSQGDGGFDGGRQIFETCQGIISNFVTNGASNDWYEKVMATIGDKSDTYSHASRVSTFAALLSMALKIGKPEDLAIAGLFHDLGMNPIPPEVTSGAREFTPEELKDYHAHPERSLNLLKAKRVSVPDSVEKMIMCHHEEITGKGFPKAMPRIRIPQEAQLLSYADQFEYLTSIEAGKKTMTPLEAHEAIRLKGTIEPSLLNSIKRILTPPAATQPEKKSS